MHHRTVCRTLLAVCCASAQAFGQAAMPLPENEPSPALEPPTEAAAPAGSSTEMPVEAAPATQAPASVQPMPTGDPPAVQPVTGAEPAAAAAPVATQSTVDDTPNQTMVGTLPSPRQALYLGLGVGGGRMQDSTMGHGGLAFDLNAGYSFTPTLSLAINFDGLIHSETAQQVEETAADDDPKTNSITHYGISAGIQAHLVDLLRVSLSGGYYGLNKDGAVEPATSDEEDPDSKTYWSPGGEVSAGVEFFQSPGGFAAGFEVRAQASFPDQEFVWNSMALVGVRWYGIGGSKQAATAQAQSSSGTGI